MTRASTPLPVAGAFLEARYPFVRDTFTVQDEDGAGPVPSWKPGIRYVPYGPDDSEAVADAEGAIVLTVVATFKPGRYPTRVFYLRQWRDPKGRLFGKQKLRMTTVAHFYAMAKGYRHDYRIATAEEQSSAPTDTAIPIEDLHLLGSQA